MTGKRIAIGAKPGTDASAEYWVRQRDGTSHGNSVKANPHTARLTVDVTPALRGRIKVAAFRTDVTVAELVRGLLEERFPDAEKDA
jgi:hypothetical protein